MKNLWDNLNLFKLAVNPRIARDNYFYGGFINFFFFYNLN